MCVMAYLQENWNDIQTNLVASLLFFPIEVLVTVFVVQRAIQSIENKKWRPARKNVALYVVRAHCQLFNSAKYVIDPDWHVDLKSHGFPEGTPQAEADFWGKTQHLRPLPEMTSHLKKVVEYNMVALDSTFHPLVSDFLLAADALLSSINHMSGAYDPKQTAISCGFLPDEAMFQMERIHQIFIREFPEIQNNIELKAFQKVEAANLIALYHKAEHLNARFELIPQPKK